MPATTPDVIVTPFGTNATGITLPIPVPSQLPGNPGFASFDDGFPTDTTGPSGLPPRWQDMQGILFMVTSYLQALTGGQFWPFNSTWEAANGGYAVGALLMMANETGFWLNTVNNNANNPDTTAAATSGWVPAISYGSVTVSGLTGGSSTLTAVQAAANRIYLTGTLTSNLQLILPPWLKTWEIVNNTTGNFTVTAKTASGTGIACAPFPSGSGYTRVWGDGTNINFGDCQGTGSFSAPVSGITGTPNVNIQYTINGRMCTLYTIGGQEAASTNTSLSFGPLPAWCVPANGQIISGSFAVNNSLYMSATVSILGGATTVNFNLDNVSGSDIVVAGSGGGGAFLGSGTKGVGIQWSITYPLN